MQTLVPSRLHARGGDPLCSGKGTGTAAFLGHARHKNGGRWWAAAGLWLRVHADAFLFDPAGYLQALVWRARGLRVRSRNRIAALTGRSGSAYRFWIACREPEILRAAKGDTDWAAILAVIDCSRGSEGLSETLGSLPQGANAVIVGAHANQAGQDSIATIGQLGRHMRQRTAWICPVGCGDRLAADAFAIYSDTIARFPATPVIYADDDLIDEHTERTDPHFKPDWNPDLFEHHDFLTGASIVRVTADELKVLPVDGWACALISRKLSDGVQPIHLPYILHHRRWRPQPVVPARKVAAGLAAPQVTVIIPTRDRADLLRTCMEGLLRTDYPKLEIIVVDNGSDDVSALTYLDELRERGVSILRLDEPFNYSKLNNAAVEQAAGELLCFLNNDVEMIDDDWLSLLVRQAKRPEIGAAGARLLYPDGTIQHAGVFTGIGGGAGHGHRLLRADEGGYFERARLPQRVSAVTGACLVVARSKFLAVGGFDAETFPVAFNDVDLCLKLNERGWQSFYEPRATLIHHESRSRGSDRAKSQRNRFDQELAQLKRKWGTDERPDPFHSPHLSPFCEQFLIAV